MAWHAQVGSDLHEGCIVPHDEARLDLAPINVAQHGCQRPLSATHERRASHVDDASGPIHAPPRAAPVSASNRSFTVYTHFGRAILRSSSANAAS